MNKIVKIAGLSNFPNLLHGFSTVQDGNMADSLENRKKFFNKLKIRYKNVIKPKQVHGNNVQLAKRNLIVVADGLITSEKNLFLLILIADCLPIIIYDPKKIAFGVVHAGWRGTQMQIAKKAIEKLKKVYFSRPKDLIIGFGPAARTPTYKKDFVGDCKSQLIEEGVLNKNIFDCGINTMTDNRFFSHRRDANEGREDQGRFACVLGLE